MGLVFWIIAVIFCLAVMWWFHVREREHEHTRQLLLSHEKVWRYLEVLHEHGEGSAEAEVLLNNSSPIPGLALSCIQTFVKSAVPIFGTVTATKLGHVINVVIGDKVQGLKLDTTSRGQPRIYQVLFE